MKKYAEGRRPRFRCICRDNKCTLQSYKKPTICPFFKDYCNWVEWKPKEQKRIDDE